ncbi:MAG: PilZ domain-containing protein [Bdellovibrionaceae bacterium]|nr:PilZ domain-containing protein [Pseudobdellovibrionaceae bacterium]
MTLRVQDMFKRVHNSARKELLKTVVEKKIPLLVKGDGDHLYHLVPLEMDGDKLISCAFHPDSETTSFTQQIICNFQNQEDRYFFQTILHVSTPAVYLDVPDEIYMLQRRKSARLDIPPTYIAEYVILQKNTDSCMLAGQLLDYGSGGCKFLYGAQAPIFAVGDKLKGVLQLGQRRPIHVQSVVKHVRRGDKKDQVVGCQFVGLDRIMETKLMTVFMDMQREIFTKF